MRSGHVDFTSIRPMTMKQPAYSSDTLISVWSTFLWFITCRLMAINSHLKRSCLVMSADSALGSPPKFFPAQNFALPKLWSLRGRLANFPHASTSEFHIPWSTARYLHNSILDQIKCWVGQHFHPALPGWHDRATATCRFSTMEVTARRLLHY